MILNYEKVEAVIGVVPVWTLENHTLFTHSSRKVVLKDVVDDMYSPGNCISSEQVPLQVSLAKEWILKNWILWSFNFFIPGWGFKFPSKEMLVCL